MALTADRYWTVIEFIDTGGKKTTRRYEQSAPLDDAAARTAALALATDIAAISDAVITKYHSYQDYIEDSLSLPAAAEIENQAVLIFSIDGEPLKSGMTTVPAPVDGIFAAGTGPNYDVVDIVDTDLAAFASNFLNGGGDELYYLSDGEQPDTIRSGHRRHIKSRRG